MSPFITKKRFAQNCDFQNNGDIARIYTYAMADQFEADLRQFKAEYKQQWLDAFLLLAIPGYLFLNLFTLRGVPHLIVTDDGLFVLDG
jgi:hypothetical protein